MYIVTLTLEDGSRIIGTTEDRLIADSMYRRFGRIWGDSARYMAMLKGEMLVRSFRW